MESRAPSVPLAPVLVPALVMPLGGGSRGGLWRRCGSLLRGRACALACLCARDRRRLRPRVGRRRARRLRPVLASRGRNLARLWPAGGPIARRARRRAVGERGRALLPALLVLFVLLVLVLVLLLFGILRAPLQGLRCRGGIIDRPRGVCRRIPLHSATLRAVCVGGDRTDCTERHAWRCS
jgi:hypothetical protein